MQVVHSSKNRFLREIFQVETTPPSLGRGTIRHLGSDQVYKVGLLALSCRNYSFLLPSIKLWLFLISFLLDYLCKSLYLSFKLFLPRRLQEKPGFGVYTVNKCNVSPVSSQGCIPGHLWPCLQAVSEPRVLIPPHMLSSTGHHYVTKFTMGHYNRDHCACCVCAW